MSAGRGRLAALLLVWVSAGVVADVIPLSAMGELQLKFSPVRAVERFPGSGLPGVAGYLPGEAFNLVAPRRIQQVQYLVAPGVAVKRGEPLARLRGPEVHHFMAEYEASRQLLEAARRRYESNRALYQRQAIREGQWIEVSERYHAANLEYEHLRHFHELVLDSDASADTITVGSPVDGIVDYASAPAGIGAGESIARLLPATGLRLRVQLPVRQRARLVALHTGDCEVEMERVEGVSSGFFVSAWSVPLPPDCGLLPGQELQLTPLFGGDAFALPRSAVFQWQESSHILLRSGEQLQAVEVQLLGSSGDEYILGCAVALRGREVLVSSVSAAQGVLMGLGGE